VNDAAVLRRSYLIGRCAGCGRCPVHCFVQKVSIRNLSGIRWEHFGLGSKARSLILDFQFGSQHIFNFLNAVRRIV
jgi:ferredoxin